MPTVTSAVTPSHFLFPVTVIPLGTLPLTVWAGSIQPTPQSQSHLRAPGIHPLVNQCGVAPPTGSLRYLPSNSVSSSGAADWCLAEVVEVVEVVGRGGVCVGGVTLCFQTSGRFHSRLPQQERNPRKGNKKNLPESVAVAGWPSVTPDCGKCLL